MNQTLTLIAAVAVCSGTAFIAGRLSSENSRDTASGEFAEPGVNAGSPASALSDLPVGPRAVGQSRAHELRQRGSTNFSSGDATVRMEAIMNNPDPLARTEEWLRFVKGLGPDEIEEVVVDFRAKDLARYNLSEYSMLLTAWAKFDPLTALDYAKENTGTPFARQTILTSWATTDPVGAMKWAEANHDGEGANPWMVGVIRGIAASDPERATELMNGMPYSRERGEALFAVQGHYLKQGPEAARNWAMSIEDERLRAGAISRIAENLARTDPVGTADWLQATESEGANRAMTEVMARMAETDTDAAIAYFEAIGDEQLKSRALEGITDQLAEKDPQAALSLINSNPSLASDDVYREFVWGTRDQDPALGAATISRIADADDRNRTYRRYLGRWLRNDREAAAGWINQNQLPQNVMRSVERMVERMDNADR
ncbi:MAG: hypothetical protein R3242_04405 [Akkermansiaceae bacterium]|nr:hypothetical protein [Akkermansiaceae bacterium]